MKREIQRLRLVVGLFLLASSGLFAQVRADNRPSYLEEEEEEPHMYKFEPGYTQAVSERRAEIERIKNHIDTLDISEKKRERLLRDLYKGERTKRLEKVLVTETAFEDEID